MADSERPPIYTDELERLKREREERLRRQTAETLLRRAAETGSADVATTDADREVAKELAQSGALQQTIEQPRPVLAPPAKAPEDLFSAADATRSMQDLKGDGPNPFIRDGSNLSDDTGTLPFNTPPLMDSQGKHLGYPETTKKQIVENLMLRHMKENNVEWADIPEAEQKRLQAQFQKQATDQVAQVVGQNQNAAAPQIVVSPEGQRKAVREGMPMLPGTNLRPLRWLADGFDAAIDIAEAQSGADLPELGNGARAFSYWAAPFTLAMTERGISEADSGTGELTKQGVFDKATKMSPYTAIAPWLAGKLTDKYEDVEWGSDKHLEWIQKGGDWMDVTDVPSLVFDETVRKKMQDLLGVDVFGGALSHVGDAIALTPRVAGRAATLPGQALYSAARAAEKKATGENAVLEDPWMPLPTLSPSYDELFTGESRGASAMLNLAVAAPLAAIEPDALSLGLGVAGKAVSAGSKGLRTAAGRKLMDLGDKAMQAAEEAYRQTGDMVSAYAALERTTPGLAPAFRDVLKTQFSLNMFDTGVKTGAELETAVRAAKDPKGVEKLLKYKRDAEKLNEDLGNAWREVDDALADMEAAREKVAGNSTWVDVGDARMLEDTPKNAASTADVKRVEGLGKAKASDISDEVVSAKNAAQQRTELEGKLKGAKQAMAAQFIERGKAAKEAQAELKRAQAALVKAEAKVKKADEALNAALTPGQRRVPKAQAALKKAEADRRKIQASFADKNTAGAKRAIEAADRRVAQAKERLAKAQKAKPKEASPRAQEKATQKRIDAALNQADLSERLDKLAEKAVSAQKQWDAARAGVPPETLAKYENFSSKQLRREIDSLGEKIRQTRTLNPLDLAQLIRDMEFVKAKEAYETLRQAAATGLTKRQRAVFQRAMRADRVLKGSAKVDDAFFKSIRDVRAQFKRYSEMIRKGESPKPIDELGTALSRGIEVGDDGVVRLLDAAALTSEVTRRYGAVPEGMQKFLAAGGGSVDEFQSALKAEMQAAREAQGRAGREYWAGQAVDDTIVQRTDPYTGGRWFTAEALAINTRRMVGRLGLLSPIAARGVGLSGDMAEAVYRRSFELNRNAELQLTKILKVGKEDTLRDFLFTTNPVDVGGVRMSGNSVGGPPITRARKHIAEMAAAGFEDFKLDSSVRALAAANIGRTLAGNAGMDWALSNLFREAKKADFSDEALKTWIWGTAPNLHRAAMGAADESGRALMFQARAVMAAANSYEITRAMAKAGWAGAASPPGGTLDKAIDFMVTRTGSSTADRGVPRDLTREALQEAVDFTQRFSTGVADRRTTTPKIPGLSFVAAAAKAVDADTKAVAWSTYAGRRLFVPENVAKALREIPDKLVKETSQFSGTSDKMSGITLDDLARTIRMGLVGGVKIPRLRLFGGTQLGDLQQMTMHPEVGPVMAAKVASVALPHIIPGAGDVAKALRGNVADRPLFASSLDDQVMAVIQGEDRLMRTAEGAIVTRAMQREAEMQGVVDALPQKDLYDALAKNPQARRGAQKFLAAVGRGIFGQSELVKGAMSVLEHEQHVKRLALYIELRKTHAPDEAGRIMRESLFDWALGVAPWETETIFKAAAFHTYRRGKWNLMKQTLLRDIAGVEKGRAWSILMPGTAMPMKGVRLGMLPSKMRDWDLEERQLSEQEQATAALEAERSGYGAQGLLIDADRLSSTYQQGLRDRTGKTATVAQLYMVQGSFEDMLLDTLLAYDVMSFTAGKLFGTGDYQTSAKTSDMAYRIATRLVETTHGDPMTERFAHAAALEFLGLEDPYKRSKASEMRNGVTVPKNVAGVATFVEGLTGFDILGTERGPDGRIIYSLDQNWAQYCTDLLFRLPTVLNDVQRQYGTIENPDWEKGFFRGLLSTLEANLLTRLELVDAQKQIDMRAGSKARDLENLEIQTETRAVPTLKGRR